ncbi:MAG: aminoacetone oxidase family FAD-binding enzyme [Planctomycetes bacterium]|nr:aminoacetone oxidase family FAD-binding enzyme [Planctomycetota bacterium]
MPKTKGPSVAIVGAGAAGLSAALEALRAGADVTIFEQRPEPARKLRLLGRGQGVVGRDDASHESFHGRHARFVQDALRAFDLDWFKKLKIKLTTDEDGDLRAPSGQVLVDALLKALKKADLRLSTPVSAIRKAKSGFKLTLTDGEFECARLVLATGGNHAPQVADGAQGLRLAQGLGHSVEDCSPALVGVRVAQYWPGRLPGLWMNVDATLVIDGREAGNCRGLVLFTRNSLTGPGLFGFSREIDTALMARKQVEVVLNFYPGMTHEQVAKWQYETFGQYARQDLASAMDHMLPMRLSLEMIRLLGLRADSRVRVFGLREREAILHQITNTRLTVAATLGSRAALGSRGGVNVREVDPRTFESKLVPGLFIAGEMLDVDGSSLAVNRQFAFGSGVLAGRNVIQNPK